MAYPKTQRTTSINCRGWEWNVDNRCHRNDKNSLLWSMCSVLCTLYSVHQSLATFSLCVMNMEFISLGMRKHFHRQFRCVFFASCFSLCFIHIFCSVFRNHSVISYKIRWFCGKPLYRFRTTYNIFGAFGMAQWRRTFYTEWQKAIRPIVLLKTHYIFMIWSKNVIVCGQRFSWWRFAGCLTWTLFVKLEFCW